MNPNAANLFPITKIKLEMYPIVKNLGGVKLKIIMNNIFYDTKLKQTFSK